MLVSICYILIQTRVPFTIVSIALGYVECTGHYLNILVAVKGGISPEAYCLASKPLARCLAPAELIICIVIRVERHITVHTDGRFPGGGALPLRR